MSLQTVYPQYDLDMTGELIERCLDIAPGLLSQSGFCVNNERFLSKIAGKPGVTITSGRVFFSAELVTDYIKAYKKKASKDLDEDKKASYSNFEETKKQPVEWQLKTDGFSMMTIDVQSGQLRPATCQDLRDMIKLANSFGVDGSYMVMPQDPKPAMQAIECFKICFEMGNNIRPYDYQLAEQIPFIYQMHQVVGRSMDLVVNIPSTFCVDPKDLDIFMDYYPIWKKNRDINFRVLNYPMSGITKPLSFTGCAAVCFCETLAVHILFNLFDPEIKLDIALTGGNPTDMMHSCWAFGSPKVHLYRYMNSVIIPTLLDRLPCTYSIDQWVHMATNSPAIDEQAAIEKMGTALTAAMQGARKFRYAGTLCVDDVYSGTQFVIDNEIFAYIRETIEAFSPHPDILDMDGLYDEIKQAVTGEVPFIASMNTAKKVRNIMSSPQLIVREKLNSWMTHNKLMQDRAKEKAIESIRTFEPNWASDDIRGQLDKIYQKAARALQ